MATEARGGGENYIPIVGAINLLRGGRRVGWEPGITAPPSVDIWSDPRTAQAFGAGPARGTPRGLAPSRDWSISPGQALGIAPPSDADPPVVLPRQTGWGDVLGSIASGAWGAIKGSFDHALELLQLYQLFRSVISGDTPGRLGYPSQYPYPSTGPPSLPMPPTTYPTTGAGSLGGAPRVPRPPSTIYGGNDTMPYTFSDLTSLITTGLQAYQTITGKGTAPLYATQPTNGGGIFNVPYVDIQSPIKLESTVAKEQAAATACQALFAPFRGSGAMVGAMRPQAHVAMNPSTGKIQWFVPARPLGFKMTHVPRRCCRGKR